MSPQIEEHLAVREPGREFAGGVHRNRGLADPRHAADGFQRQDRSVGRFRADRRGQGTQFGTAADKRGLAWQVARRKRGGWWSLGGARGDCGAPDEVVGR
ncbi:hypothetical protein OG757_20795 [Streptomyces sp. NBC_01262]|nr:hypothetical protein [Streptomyces sp. NBC_01262]